MTCRPQGDRSFFSWLPPSPHFWIEILLSAGNIYLHVQTTCMSRWLSLILKIDSKTWAALLPSSDWRLLCRSSMNKDSLVKDPPPPWHLIAPHYLRSTGLANVAPHLSQEHGSVWRRLIESRGCTVILLASKCATVYSHTVRLVIYLNFGYGGWLFGFYILRGKRRKSVTVDNLLTHHWIKTFFLCCLDLRNSIVGQMKQWKYV